ncbi:MAG: HEAT repeat domain-containing protein [Candidatus Cloacimonadales bacterium]
MKRAICLILIIFSGVFLAAEVLQQQEQKLFEDLMQSNDLEPHSVNFLKDWSAETDFKLPLVVDIINQPFRFPQFAQTVLEILQPDFSREMLQLAAEILYQADLVAEQRDYQFYRERCLAEIKQPQDIFSYVEAAWQESDQYYQAVFKDLTAVEKSQIYYFALSLYAEKQAEMSYENYYQKYDIEQYPDLEIAEIKDLFEKIDFAAMLQAAYLQQSAFNALVDFLQQQSWDIPLAIEQDSAWGKMIIGSNQNDLYRERYSLIIDLAGNDQYQGEINTDFENSYYWIIDLEGDDSYNNRNLRSMLSATVGLGFSYDGDGNDLYLLGDLGLSAFFGYNFHRDYCGEDSYRAGLHSLGAASYGLAILQSDFGNDIYSVSQLGQGFGGTLGLGILYDRAGNDLYFAGGKYLHEPLAPYDHRSLAQGFGYGLRPHLAGGIGILADSAGNDRYDGGVYAQGVGYWYALGLLLDVEGNDFYNAVYYPQGSGIHLAGGLLYDGAGEDSYYSKHGPGQGAGHDYGVGFLIDRSGDDAYSVEGGNGLGLANSVGIFLDAAGDDRYERQNDSNYGVGRLARGSGSIGLFIDKGGQDKYAVEQAANESEWQSGKYGLAADLVIANPLRSIEQDSIQRAATVDSLAAIEEIFSLAAGWAVGNNSDSVKRAAEILLKRDAEAAEYIAQNQMNSRSGLTWRAISNYAQKSEIFKSYYPQLLESSDSLIVKNTISLLGLSSDDSQFPKIKSFLEAEKYLPTILSALGQMENRTACEILAKYIQHESEKIRVITARSLKSIDSDLSRELLQQMKDDSSFLIRSLWENMPSN